MIIDTDPSDNLKLEYTLSNEKILQLDTMDVNIWLAHLRISDPRIAFAFDSAKAKGLSKIDTLKLALVEPDKV